MYFNLLQDGFEVRFKIINLYLKIIVFFSGQQSGSILNKVVPSSKKH